MTESNLQISGSLWDQVIAKSQQALVCGALQSISTTQEKLEQNDLMFIVRVCQKIAKKQAMTSKTAGNPFLPYEENLFVADLPPSHVALLNKFNVVEHHLLIITRHFEAQESWLTLSDFTALAQSMKQINGLAFYNGGKIAGASQKHKHLQLVTLPPIQEAFSAPIATWMTAPNLAAGILPKLPFLHAVAPLSLDWSESPQALAANFIQHYQNLYKAVGLQHGVLPQPYNLLVTRQWMLLVPRSQESYANISVNALGFAGSLFVRNREQLEQLQSIGPMTLLQHVTYPR
ncbi:MAG: phosphorylase [Leptolyngbyaceae cyanobacterium MAG.088]|nr:phosphorylase [Leptolyngbyaceae cyanobacterium MAG.088]